MLTKPQIVKMDELIASAKDLFNYVLAESKAIAKVGKYTLQQFVNEEMLISKNKNEFRKS